MKNMFLKIDKALFFSEKFESLEDETPFEGEMNIQYNQVYIYIRGGDEYTVQSGIYIRGEDEYTVQSGIFIRGEDEYTVQSGIYIRGGDKGRDEYTVQSSIFIRGEMHIQYNQVYL